MLSIISGCARVQLPMKKVRVTVPLQRPEHPHKLEILEKQKKHKKGNILKSFSTHRGHLTTMVSIMRVFLAHV